MIEIINYEEDKNMWHDLRKDPDILPGDDKDIELCLCFNGGSKSLASGRWHNDIKEFAVDVTTGGTAYALALEFEEYMKKKSKYKGVPFYVIAWREINLP